MNAGGALARALASHRGGDVAQALRLYREILAQQPGHIDALRLCGAAELQQGRPADALACFDRVLALAAAAPPGLHANRGAALRELGRHAEALASLDRALAQQPGDARAWSNRAATLLDLDQPAQALADIERALALDAGDAAAHHNHGNALLALGRAADALGAFDRALALAPEGATTHLNRGLACAALGRDDAALASFTRARAIAPDTPWLFGHWLHAKLKCCDWDGLDAAFATLARGIDAGVPLAAPYVALHAPLDAARQQACARRFARGHAAGSAAPIVPVRPESGGRIRIGYFSADFRSHPTALLVAGVLERHARERFEISAFALGPPVHDPMNERLRRAVDRFVELPARPDHDVAALVRQLPIDIAVDLGGYTRHARPGLFAARAAPLQIGWLGYPGTLGAPWFDYLVADGTVVPDAHRAYYDEHLIRLPHCYQPNDPPFALDAPPPRAALGLPEHGVVFCAFQQAARLGPDAFGAWMRLLARVPGSVLWLLDPGPAATQRLRAAASAQGIGPQRLVFAPRVPRARHLARLAAADLCLDTRPYGAHTTGSDALRAGVPLLTVLGETFASRVAASLLRAVGMGELVTASPAEAEQRALELAGAPARLATLQARLVAQRATAPLFDTARFTRGLEAGYSVAWARRVAGRPAADLQVLEDALGDPRVVEQPPVAQPPRGVQARTGQ